VTYNPNGEPGNRITEIKVGGVPLDLNADINVATNDWIASGGDDYDMVPALFENTLPLAHPEITSLTDAVVWYISTDPEIPSGTGRIIKAADVTSANALQPTETPKTGHMPITVTIAVVAVSAIGMVITRKKHS
jgi:2',3'-cyclic-nucleotide 2'-phosphodiesterase (5'-nucleotidase family)